MGPRRTLIDGLLVALGAAMLLAGYPGIARADTGPPYAGALTLAAIVVILLLIAVGVALGVFFLLRLRRRKRTETTKGQ
jgi:drug/metabolite transporter (DMT)-like permease